MNKKTTTISRREYLKTSLLASSALAFGGFNFGCNPLAKSKLNIAFLILIISCNTIIANAQKSDKPNIVFILADDFGYGSVNTYGADKNLVRTPTIDRIAEKGMMFNNAYAAASVCTPTRYSLMMGSYPWRSALKYGVWGASPSLINQESKTIADWLKESGYNTAAIGKWHLGYGKSKNREEFTGTLSPGPLDLGFDYHFGVPSNHGDKMGVFIENDHIYGLRSNKIQPYSRTFYGPQYYGFDAPQCDDIQTMENLTDKTVAPDSRSFYPSLMEQKDNSARTSLLTADMNGMQAVRMGEWKYIDNTLPEEMSESRRMQVKLPLQPELYNLAEDPGESKNLFDQYPEVVKKLSEELNRIRTQKSTR